MQCAQSMSQQRSRSAQYILARGSTVCASLSNATLGPVTQQTCSNIRQQRAHAPCRRCFAAEAWRQHFAADPLSRDAGDHLRRNLLQLGGAAPPRDLVQGLLGERALVSDGAGGWMPAADSYLAELQTLRAA